MADPIVSDVARAVRLVEGERGVEAVVAALARLEPVSIRALGRAVDLPVPIVAAVCNELRRHGVVSEERPAQLTIDGRRRFGGARAAVEATCPGCGGRGIALPEAVARLRRGLAQVAEAAPAPRVELDQCHCTPKTKLRRVLALHEAGALTGRRILLLGDDDLTSLTLLRFVQHFGSTVEELAVLDVDERVLAFIEDGLAEAPFPTRCLRWDLREPLPAPSSDVSTPSSPTRRTRPRAPGSSSRARWRRCAAKGRASSSRSALGGRASRSRCNVRSARRASRSAR